MNANNEDVAAEVVLSNRTEQLGRFEWLRDIMLYARQKFMPGLDLA